MPTYLVAFTIANYTCSEGFLEGIPTVLVYHKSDWLNFSRIGLVHIPYLFEAGQGVHEKLHHDAHAIGYR